MHRSKTRRKTCCSMCNEYLENNDLWLWVRYKPSQLRNKKMHIFMVALFYTTLKAVQLISIISSPCWLRNFDESILTIGLLNFNQMCNKFWTSAPLGQTFSIPISLTHSQIFKVAYRLKYLLAIERNFTDLILINKYEIA